MAAPLRTISNKISKAALGAAVSSDNFLNGTHELPTGAVLVPDRPDATVTLQDGKWTYTWNDLPKEVTQGSTTTTYTYYVVETEVNLAGDNETVESRYDYVYNDDGSIKTVTITNTVQPKTSLEVTKKWLAADGKDYVPEGGQRTITFQVHQVVDGEDTIYPKSDTFHTVTYDTTENKWSTETISGLPTMVKRGNALKKATYYVVETNPGSSASMVTYYEANGKTYSDPADAAGATQETIVNKNSQREITVTKKWYYQNGSQVVEATEPPEKDVYFKIKQDDDSWYTADTDKLPTSNVTPEGYKVSKADTTGGGTVFHLVCSKTETTKQSELDPNQTYTVTTWSWNTLTFASLPTGHKYYLVETDAQGRELLSDETTGTKIEYLDENGKAISASSPIDPNIPGNYTIKNTERRTSLYAQKVWQGANKDNLAGNESVWFSLMRVETDGNGHYNAETLQETPGIGRFALKQSSGWTKYFDSIEVAPPERHSGDQWKYWQYFIVELGLLKPDTPADATDAQKQYKLIDDLTIKYQSKGSGTAADGSTATGRAEFLPYSQGVAGITDSTAANYRTVDQWLNANRDAIVAWLGQNGPQEKVRLNTWASGYDGMGTLGVFNSSEEYLQKPLEIKKEWKDANGNDLSPEQMAVINAGTPGSDADADLYQVQIQLMQHAYDIEGRPDTETHDVEYGAAFMVDPWKVVKNSDLFEVAKKGTAAWAFEIPVENRKGEPQLPSKGPFRLPDGSTAMASFTYYVSEYQVFDATGKDVTTEWTAACLTSGSGSTYSLTLENRKTTDLTLHKSWEGVSAANRGWVNDNVKAVLFKVYRKAPDEVAPTDITEYIYAMPASYGLTREKTYDVGIEETIGGETGIVFEDFVRVDQPDGGWWSGNDSKDAKLLIGHLDALVKDYHSDSNLSAWPKYQYWVEERGYVDAQGVYHDISELQHGETASYPKYQSSTTGASALATSGTAGSVSASASSCGKSAEIQLGAEGQSHLGAINTARGVDLTVIKQDANDKKKLIGAKFELLKKDASGKFVAFDFDANNGTQNVTIKAATDKSIFTITSTNGFTVKGLMPGEYQLTETEPPAGYIKTSDNSIHFAVREDGSITKPGNNEEDKPRHTLPEGNFFKFTARTASASASVTVDNEPGAELPAAGGAGVAGVYALGVALVAASAAALLRRRRA